MTIPPEPRLPDASGHARVGHRRIWWERFGPGGRETVCLLNGLAMHTKAWYSFVDRLSPEWDVLLYDYPGQGESTADDAPVSMPELAEGLAAAADAAAAGPLHPVGISYGGFVAAEFARLHPARVASVVLSGILLSREELFEMYEALSLRFYRGGPEVFELYTHYMYEKIFGEAFVRRAREQLEAMRQRFFERYRDRVHALVRLTEAQDPFFAALDQNRPGYAAVPCPVLVLAGAEDRAIPPRVQRKLVDVFAHARYVELPGSGHVVHLEATDAFFSTVRAFLRARSLAFDLPAGARDGVAA